jgi:pyrophosphate--fructose-6-phosphate 1-phosphotransferase
MSLGISNLQKARAEYQPKLPKALSNGFTSVELGAPTEPATHKEAIKELFPLTYGQPIAKVVLGKGRSRARPLKVGVVLSGGQAPGGHNVIAGLFDALKAVHQDSRLFGFLKGPKGVIDGACVELTAETIDQYRNTGGFDMIMSGRDKIEEPKHLRACKRHCSTMRLDGLVVIGGDDSNTNAAVLAEHLRAKRSRTCIIGVPKTIDGDLKNEYIEASFGFDTASKLYSELIGNICRDATSAVKYWHFIRLMGRSASHIALECALQTHPNITLIAEEVEKNPEIQSEGMTLAQIVDYIVDIVIKRARAGKSYGILLVPEGLVEFIPEIEKMIRELSGILAKDEEYIRSLPDHSERVQYLSGRFTAENAKVYNSLPEGIQEVLLKRDKFGNVPLSQVETERLLIDLVSDKIRFLKKHDEEAYKFLEFSPLSHFFGYEGRCAAPSNFDADYTYSLGYAAAQLIRAKLSGYTVSIQNLTRRSDEWVAGGVPITMMLNMELRKGQWVPVVKKALVDLNGRPFREFAKHRDSWALDDEYVFPGPIQYFGPPEACEMPTITLALEKNADK